MKKNRFFPNEKEKNQVEGVGAREARAGGEAP